MSVCRLCLSGRRVRHGLFEPLSPLIHKIRFCLPLQISETDSLPKKICDICIQKINDIYEFVHKTLNAQEELLTDARDPSGLEKCAIEEDETSDKSNDVPDFVRIDERRVEIDPECDVKRGRIVPADKIKSEPPDAYNSTMILDKNFSVKDGPCSVENLIDLSKYVSTYTQTDELDFGDGRFADSNLEFPTRDSDQYSSDDDITLNKIVKIEKECSDSIPPVPNKKSNKRKKEINSVIVKKSRGRPKGSSNKRVNLEKITKKKLKDDYDDEVIVKSEKNDDDEPAVIQNCDDKFYSDVVKEESSKLWQCLICFVYEKNKADLLQHYKDHVENPSKISMSPIKPLVIKEELKSETDDGGLKNENTSKDFIKVQSKEFSDDPAYQCLKCYKLFINRKSVIRHLICHDDSRPYPCNICGRTYKRAYEILLHGRAHSGVKTLFCKYELCNYSTAYRGALLSHQKRHDPDYKYTCEVCKKGFDVLTWFTEHKNVHTGDRPFSCNLCGKNFIYSRYLASHRKSVHPETDARKLLHRCEKCNEEFPYRKKLQKHIQRVHDSDFAMHVLCDICGKRLSSKEHLKFHRRIHTGEKPHNCRTCGKSFVKKCNLTLHERIHSGERPHVCSHCGKAFSQRSTLVIHERYHNGSRPYQCEICSKAFVAKGLLSMHQKTCV